MNRLTTLILLIVVAGLGAAVWWQTEREESGEFDFVERLAEGVDVQRVRAMRIDNLERSVHVTLERDERHVWSITDPIAYPARQGIIDLLLDIVRDNPAVVVPGDELDFAEAGFDPPRALFDVIERMPDGGERTVRIELGALDLDGSRVYVRRGGKIFRTLRNLDTTLQRFVDDYRSHRVFDVAPLEIVRFTRRGRVREANGERDLFVDATRRSFDWWLDQPVKGRLDPTIMTGFVATAASYRIDRFVDDAPIGLVQYGLQDPQVQIEVEDASGLAQVFLMGRADGEWYGKREDLPYVWGLDSGDVYRLFLDVDDLIDRNLVRVLRDEVDQIELTTASERIVIEPDRSGDDPAWTVRAAEDRDVLPANRERVEALLSDFEHAEILRFLTEDELRPDLRPGPDDPAIWITMREQRQGGLLGPQFVTEGGAPARTFVRRDEEQVGLVPVALAERLENTTLRSLMSLQLLALDEQHLRKLVLRRGETEQTFVRAIEGTWRYVDLDTVADELFSVLDALFFLRATEHLGPGDEPLVDKIEYELIDYEGASTRAVVGLGPDGRVEAELNGRRAVLKDQGLHGRLATILAD